MTVEDVNIYQSITFYHKTLMLCMHSTGRHNTIASIYIEKWQDFSDSDSPKKRLIQINQHNSNKNQIKIH